MKKLCKISLLICLILLSTLALIACKDGGGEDSKQLSAPINLVVNQREKQLSWDAVENASSYTVDIIGLNSIDNGIQTICELSQLTDASVYKLRVKAIGDGKNYIDSNWSEEASLEVVEPVVDSFGYSFINDGTEYRIEVGRYLTHKEIIIPSHHNGKPVTQISSSFNQCKELTKITIPDTITSIDCDTFEATPWYKNQPDGLIYAGKVLYKYKGTMPQNTVIDEIRSDTVTIADLAFYGQLGLVDIVVPNSVRSIGGNSFVETGWYNNQPDGIVYAGKVLYKYKGTVPNQTALNNIREDIVSITDAAFQNQRGLVDITIPNGITSIGMRVFEGCGFSSITIPDGVTKIAGAAFKNCDKLEQINLPDSVIILSGSAFDATKWYQNQSGPAVYVGKILYQAWSLKVMDDIRPDTIALSDYALFNSHFLQEITLPSSVVHIGPNALRDCSVLTKITVADDNPKYKAEGNCLIDKTTNTVIVGCRTSVIPSDVTAIEDGAFKDSAIRNVVVPEGVTRIGHSAFSGSLLTNITISSSVKTIGNAAFYDCGSLESISVNAANTVYKSDGNCLILSDENALIYGCETSVIPSYVTIIRESAFYGAVGLTNIIIPNSVTTIEDRAFAKCASLKSVTIANTVTTMGKYVFEGSRATVYTAAVSLPSGWDPYFVALGGPLIWGCKLSNDKTYVVSFVNLLYTIDNVNQYTINAPYRKGYIFDHWTVISAGGSATYLAENVGDAPSFSVLTANWSPVS